VISNFAMSFAQYVNGPRLYRLYAKATEGSGEAYSANLSERWGDFVVGYGLPVGGIYCAWQRKLNYCVYLGLIMATSYLLRAAGRYTNPTYVSFFQLLQRAKTSMKIEDLEKLRRFDFQFSSWPTTFTSTRHTSFQPSKLEGLPSPSWILGWLVAHSFGIRLVYPGLWLGPLLRTPLEEARARYVVEKGGFRARVGTVDGNGIDTMFFNRRQSGNSNGKTLVICCEGNAGFYEIGMAKTPMDLGYSILGWNHPGFGGSSGVPYPPYVLNAAEAVFDYAVSELGFKEEEIILYGWSIGGFPSTHLARNHPKVKGLMLDATFDDVLPLALPRMPAILSPMVNATIRNHINLQISDEMAGYKGPVRLIRRTDDEIICEPPNELIGNRGNFLLKDLLRQRYPNLMQHREVEAAIDEWLAKPHILSRELQEAVLSEALIVPDDTSAMSLSEKKELIVKLAEKFLTDFKSTHCTELQPALFKLPWVPTVGYRLGSGN